jgi:hypothetical protein
LMEIAMEHDLVHFVEVLTERRLRHLQTHSDCLELYRNNGGHQRDSIPANKN